MKHITPSLLALGDQAVCIQYNQIINEDVHKQVINDYNKLIQHKHSFIVDIIPAYCSISVLYCFEKVMQQGLNKSYYQIICDWILECLHKPNIKTDEQKKLVEIPACYHESVALDIQRIANGNKISVEEIIQQHISKTYRVFMLGFLPGFPYMGLVHPSISYPRLPEPRTRVEAGSIGIAGEQTGIYPIASPGGWNIIARTPIQLFNSEIQNPCLLQPGDEVRFVPISLQEFNTYHSNS